ncbi:low-specificity L-threonine aldolase [candidate division KSB1 bacterium]|nr:MAG: low-specificity L-threonine aldolase [candidate division KSB1 bacterium]
MQADLRSDTFTKPGKEMRQVMANAEVGDDVFGEDPTVNKLQDIVAEMTGKEAGLFVASGTMGNQVAVNTLTQPGQEVILDANAHIFFYEAGAPALLSGVQLRPVKSSNGILTAEEIEPAIRADNIHFPPTSLICLENTLNRAGGRIFPLEEIKKIRLLADKHGIKMHLDGARLWNASVAAGIPLHEYGKYFETMSLCFSKGLGAPVGSIVVGDSKTIDRARRYRKIYGGGMRQAGIIAAGALYAVENNFKRLTEDHKRAKILAETINSLNGFEVNLDSVQTNIVIVTVTRKDLTAENVADMLAEKEVLVLALGERMLRLVTHLDVSEEEVLYAADVLKELFG